MHQGDGLVGLQCSFSRIGHRIDETSQVTCGSGFQERQALCPAADLSFDKTYSLRWLAEDVECPRMALVETLRLRHKPATLPQKLVRFAVSRWKQGWEIMYLGRGKLELLQY